MSRSYLVNEVFYSVQGEGRRTGEASTFVRLSKCNMECREEPGPKSPGGFDCDTEFESGRRCTLGEIAEWIEREEKAGGVAVRSRPWIVLTGGEPALQVDVALLFLLRDDMHRQVAIETNGSIMLPPYPRFDGIDESEDLDEILASFPLDWITVSPKVAEHAIKQRWCHELKYVRAEGQGIPQTKVRAMHQYLSPAFDGLEPNDRHVAWCMRLVREHPDWALTGQTHKLLQIGGGRVR